MPQLAPAFSKDRLRTLREQRKLSQEALARRAGLALLTVNRLENGHRTAPTADTLSLLAHALGCSIDDLFTERAA
jgi:transcriptional regulator with XRE-family HTH domain